MNQHARPHDAPREAGALLFALIEAGHALQDRLEDALGAVGLSLAKHGLLTTLVEEGAPLTLGELAERQRCVRSNITQLVDRLEDDRLVRRDPDPSDRRSIWAVLTPEGQARQAAGAAAIQGVTSGFLEQVPAEDREALGRFIARLG